VADKKSGGCEKGYQVLRRSLMSTSLSALAILALTLGNSGAALAGAPPSLSIENKASLSTGGVIVVVDANCGAGATAGEVSVVVSQSPGNAVGNGTQPFTSDGTRQRIAVTVVGGPFNVGAAAASAALSCGGNLTGLDLGAKITIQ
jgi:hypothetical protein